jgi:diaminopimelate epimerase
MAGLGLKFAKYEGLGNDFIVVDAASPAALSSEQAKPLCDRRLGVGADGVLLVVPPATRGAVAGMRVLNADGSIPEMCGNGLRCVALHLARQRNASRADFIVDTDSGPRECVVSREGNEATVVVDMGEVRSIGTANLDIGGKALEVALADAGNPHAIVFGSYSRADVESLGPLIERHSSFARGTNVEFARVQDRRIELVVWERGVGITLACGTGACATAVVARERGLITPAGEVIVSLPGGDLSIDPAPRGRTKMTGPARLVFTGELP